jgi:YD repeat-containing protein
LTIESLDKVGLSRYPKEVQEDFLMICCRTLIGMIIGLVGCASGCGTGVTFVLGSGSTFGTMTYGGVEYQIFTNGAGQITQIVTSTGEQFDVDENGNLTGVTTNDGTVFGFNRNDDGTITVTFANSPEFGSGQVITNPNARGKKPEALTRRWVKTLAMQDAAGDCAELIVTCEEFESFLSLDFPFMRDDIVAAMKARHPELPDIIADPIINSTINGYINRALELCAGIKLIKLLELPPCDTGGQ